MSMRRVLAAAAAAVGLVTLVLSGPAGATHRPGHGGGTTTTTIDTTH